MAVDTWENLLGSVVEGRYRLRRLTYSENDHAEYLADLSDSQAMSEPLTVTLINAAPDDVDAVRSQLQMASRLQHPNLVRILSAGESAVEGQFMLYLASETPDLTLASALMSGPLPKDSARGLAVQILGALTFLHEQGLVYRALDPQSTVRINGRWKLGNFGLVCAAGDSDSEPPPYESPYHPPEWKTGPVTSAWDIWAFGVLLREALTGQVTKVRKLPRPFEDIVQGCLAPQPEQRLTAAEIRAMLTPTGAPGTPEAAPPPQVRIAQAGPAAVRTHYAKVPQSANVWRSLRILALIAIVCLIVILPFSLRKKSTAHPEQAAPTGAAPAVTAPKPAARTTHAANTPAAAAKKADVARAGYISPKMNGRKTASGERFDSHALTASTRAYPLGTRLRVTNLSNSKSVMVRVNDRGPRGHVIALTERAARDIGITHSGKTQVLLEVVQ